MQELLQFFGAFWKSKRAVCSETAATKLPVPWLTSVHEL